MRPLQSDIAQQLPEKVLFRIVRGDEKGRPFGTPRNPRSPTLPEFNPRIQEVRAGELGITVVARRHGLFPEQTERIADMTNEDLVAFRIEDPISATIVESGLSLTGGHHRCNEIIERVTSGSLSPNTTIEVLVHD